MDLLLPMMVFALLIGGLGVAILGSVKVALARRLQIDEARVGGLVSLFGFTMIPVIFTAGFLIDEVDRQVVLISGSILFSGSLVWLGFAKTYRAALVGVILLSAAWSLLINVGNVLTPDAFGGSEAFAFNLANVFFGLGAFLTPLAVTMLLRRMSFSITLSLLGGLSLVPGLLALGAVFPPVRTPPGTPLGLGALLADPMLWLCGMALFFYGPLEASLAAWATTYLLDHGVREDTASGLLSGFWLAFMLARLTTALALSAFTLPPETPAILILVLAVASTVVLTCFVMNRSRSTAMLLVPTAGLVFGPIFPTLIAVLLGHFPANVHGRAVGLFFAIGGIGWTMIPILIGRYARRTSVQRGFAVAVAAAVGLSIVAAILATR